jgi:hypothetical protein
MSARNVAIAVSVLACACGCSRSGGPGDPAVQGAAETRIFLQQLVQVRGLINADNADRIPAMIRGEDSTMLTEQVLRFGQYRQTLSKLDPSRVDAQVLQLGRSVEGLLGAYRSVCLDSAELFREIVELDSKQPERGPMAPAIKNAMASSQGDTLAALDSLIEATGDLDTSPNGSAVFLVPVLNAVRGDRAKLKLAIDAQQELARQIKTDSGE